MNKIIHHLRKSLWLGMVPFGIASIAAIALLVTGQASLSYLWVTLVMWSLISGLGVAVGFHRVFSHKTHKLPMWFECVMLFFGALAAQGTSIFWVAVHRGYHHPHADTERDIHSPVTKSLWHSFFGWTTQITNATVTKHVNIKYAADLIRQPHHVWFSKHTWQILWGVPLFVALFDWKMALIGFCLATFIGLLQDNLVNVFGHLKAGIGYRRFNLNDNSHNNVLFGLLAWGQGWHNNHHHDPKSYDFGTAISGKLWEVDPCRIYLPILNFLDASKKTS